jgi:hypothetical protein
MDSRGGHSGRCGGDAGVDSRSMQARCRRDAGGAHRVKIVAVVTTLSSLLDVAPMLPLDVARCCAIILPS